MKTKGNRWNRTLLSGLLFWPLVLAGNLVNAATPCDIELNQPSYSSGETVSLSVFRLTNSSTESQFYEWKLWFRSPGLPVTSLVNYGFNSELALPAGFDVDFAGLVGPIVLFTIDDVLFPSGSYEVGCRLVDPVTGEEYPDADIITFSVL